MNLEQIDHMLRSLDQTLIWVKEFTLLLNEEGVLFSSNTPGQAAAAEVLADAKIHRMTTTRSGIGAVGFDELIAALETISPTTFVLNIGLIGSSKRGVLYCANGDQVLGAVVVNRRQQVDPI